LLTEPSPPSPVEPLRSCDAPVLASFTSLAGAVKAGAEGSRSMTDMFLAHGKGGVLDPSGGTCTVLTHKEYVSVEDAASMHLLLRRKLRCCDLQSQAL
jgi:hypothetical protein